MQWGIVNTPSWEDNVIVPGSDIFDYAVAGDGDTIYAIGAINSAREDAYSGGNFIGLSGSFYFTSGTITVTKVSDTAADVEGRLIGSACYLRGDFAAALAIDDIGILFDDGEAIITGKVTYGTASDEMTFSGKLYGLVSDSGTVTLGSGTICIRDWWVQPFEIGSGSTNLDVDLWSYYLEPRVWKSGDGGVTWDDITANVQSAANLAGPFMRFGFGGVAVAPDDEDWLVIAGEIYYPPPIDDFRPAVVASKDGGDNFSYAGDMDDGGGYSSMAWIYDIAVSPEVDDIHNIAVAGMNDRTPGTGRGTIFRLKAGTWLSGAWEDTSDTTNYAGWDNGVAIGDFTEGVVAVSFSPNFDIDDTIVCLGVADGIGGAPAHGIPYLQSGIWESGTGSWNDEAGFTTAVELTADGDILQTGVYLRSMGLALPTDYDGSDPGARVVFLYVDAYNVTTKLVGGFVCRVDNSSVSTPYGPRGEPLLASIAFHGEADTGKMMVGKAIDWENNTGDPPGAAIPFDCCTGVSVWHTEELDPCCPKWEEACKNPSGPYAALVAYTPDGDKAYASTSGATDPEYLNSSDFWGGLCDESAFSVSLDDGVSFNQLGLIDTDIDRLSDMVVCPDCGVIYLATINEYECDVCSDCSIWDWDVFGYVPITVCEVCSCDSIWRSYDNGDTWERVFHGDWVDTSGHGGDELLLRLPCDELEECCTVYLGIKNYGDGPMPENLRTIFYSRDCGQCWNEPPATKIDIQDIAVESENVVYVLDSDGYVSKSTQYGRRWSDAVDTEVGSGHTITACCDQGMVVVGGDGDDPVAYSEDGGETWELTADLPGDAVGDAHVVCDPICEGTIYAALSRPVGACGGIYRWNINESSDWDNLDAYKYGYYGIVMGRSDGTLYAATDHIMVDPDEAICDRFVAPPADGLDRIDSGYEVYSGVARNLTPCETACCGTEDWDYLICGLGTECIENNPGPHCAPTEFFHNEPSALRICGCTSIATNSVLYAIDHNSYEVIDGSQGTLWSYEDCAAKLGPTLTAPADGSVLDCEPCAGCDAANFTLKWERMCEACSYDIQIMDEDGNIIVEWVDEEIVGDPPTLFVDGTMDSTKYFLECGMNYTWHVRESNTLCECVHSPWSDTWSFTVAVGAADAIQLLAPEKGAMGVPIENVGFSWTSVRNATSYSFVLSPNANLAGALVSQDQSTTAFNYVGPLDYSKAYYWQIIAWQDGTRLTTSSIGVFNTMAEPAAPTPPVVVEEQPAPVINIPPAEQITPIWIYAIIGIGCTLAVVVIVLIVRTRRP
jgi:hypothetical protein